LVVALAAASSADARQRDNSGQDEQATGTQAGEADVTGFFTAGKNK
jgi:hypothetical protein